MPTVANNPITAPMTPEQQGVFYELVKAQSPQWLMAASAQMRNALYKSLTASHASRAEVVNALSQMKSPEDFCAPLLAKAMSDKLGEELDIAGIVFQHIRSTSSLLGLRKKLITPIDRDLLSAACENFEVGETLPGNYHEDSLIYQPERISGHGNKILAIKPYEFAGLCRTLDLGKQYQTHLNSLFAPEPATGEVRDKCIAHSQRCFEVDRHIALMKKHISADVYKMLESVRNNQGQIKLGNNSLAYQRLELLDLELRGAMFIGPVSDHADDDYRCVVYLPGDPLQPLKEYASFTHFEVELSRRLRVEEFRAFFIRFIALGDRFAFLQGLDSGLLNPPNNPLPSDSLYLSLSGFDVKGDLFSEMYRQHMARVMADARLLVVPTDDEDQKTRLDRLERYKGIGLNLLLLGASFVPLLGEIIMAVGAAQLLLEVYEGIESWSQGEQEQATDYLFDIVENLTLAAAFSAGAGAVGKTYKRIRNSTFIDGLREIRLLNGQRRLWKSDLTAYRHSLVLPRKLKFDERGLGWINGQAYLPIGNDVYGVRPRPETDLWEVRQPAGRDGYAPLLETNGLGAWRHDSELPQEWDRLTLFRRLGYSAVDIPDETALQVLAASGIEENHLRQILLDRTSPPALLVDTVYRFRADHAVSQFIEQLQVAESASLADSELQLRLLTSLGDWPGDTSLNIVDTAGKQLKGFGPASASKKIKLEQGLVRKGQFFPVILAALNAAQRERLLGSSINDSTAQALELARLLAKEADLHRLDLFAWVYQRNEALQGTQAAPLLAEFPGLPVSIADELVRNADTHEWNELDAARVPLRLAEEARRYMQVVRQSRAYEGLYLNATGWLDTDRLVFATLEQLPGWLGGIYVLMFEGTFYVEEAASIGTKDAPERLVIYANADSYSARDDDSTLAFLPKRTREHYFEALWKGLSAQRRKALGVEAEDQGVALREKITALVLQRRLSADSILGIQAVRPGYISPMRLADPVNDIRLVESSTHLQAPSPRSPAIVHRAKELYPMHSPEQINSFLRTLGKDEVLALRKLESLRLEFQTLREALETWINRQTWQQDPDGPRLKVPRLGKSRAAQAIIRSWRRETPGTLTREGMLYDLRFPALRLGELPVIKGDFSHVGTLVMERVGTSAGMSVFLQNFSNLRTLSLTGNFLTRLPQAIGSMSRLEQLDLSENQIRLTVESVKLLADVKQLQALNLNFNPALNLAPDVTHLQHLELLALRGTGISEWPIGTSGLSRLRTLDLRDNQIGRIPEEVFKASLELNRGTNIQGNLLVPGSLQRVATYQELSGISLGIITSDFRREAARVLNGLAQLAPWLAGASTEQVLRKNALWTALAAYPDSRAFFSLLDRLRGTLDFRAVYVDLNQRVWDVLEAAGEDDALRRSLFRMASIGRISADGASLLFSDLEVRVLCFRAMAAATTDNRVLEGAMIVLARGLFRLQEVERLALSEINARARTEPETNEQALEISLAYRVGLAARLDLPAQPREINTRLSVEVTPAQLDEAYDAVLDAEQTSALLESINAQGFWIEFLERAYSDQFLAISDRSALAFVQLDGQLELTREASAQRMNRIVDNFKNERRELLKSLTTRALTRNPGPQIPGAVGG
ncbi:NEL-type E3 ubiquitin ligase domain-containing protein [Pseudomonas fluorescens]|uniref:RING-type E3 ubiquitin transferase n=1 Tax=Pseudomonas fluorescens TaxID=294 RepID=A0A5E7CWX0_PSEFL|nr:NEL-type E3 ubiquitin ligase domain-containing protein [Pseudomonas fluorescens]VVO04245.1 hypothetical protein PS691_02872 [Pseudomonas fluorescens]